MNQVNQEVDIVKEYNVHNYRKNNLVYVATPKCGSRYYSTLLLENNWDQIPFWKINWGKDYVFGFIRDPYIRYLKGVVQDIFESESIDFDNCITQMIRQFKKFNLPMTPHSVPISILLQGYYQNIKWIPIGDRSHEEFIKICQEHDIEIGHYDSENVDPHHSDKNKQSFYLRLKKEFEQSNELYQLFCKEDQKIYDEAKLKLEFNSQI